MKSIFLFILVLCCCFLPLHSFAGGLILVAPEGSNWQLGGRPDILPNPRPIPRPILPPHFTPFSLELRSEKASVSINDQAVRTEIEQIFYNPSYSRLEGWFMLPLPAGSTIADFTMTVNGKELSAELLDAKKARQIYEDIVRNLRDPALLEYDGQDMFKVRIFPIEPHEEKRIKIAYTQILTPDDATIEYIYPLNTQKYSLSSVGEMSIDLTVNAVNGIKNIYCPTHNAQIAHKGNTATVKLEGKAVKNDTDFRLYYTLGKDAVGMSLLTHRPAGEDGFFMLTLTPNLSENSSQASEMEKDIAFVLDVSGSMTDGKLDKAKEALRFCIAQLNEKDRFNVVRFSTEARALFDDLQNANKDNKTAATQFIDALKPIGGTNIDEALNQVLAHKTSNNRPYLIVFITDGKPTIGITEEDELLTKVKRYNTSNTRIFTVGIGNDLNTHLLDKITEQTRAFRTYITPSEDIEIKLSNFYTKISTPALSDLRLSFGRNIDVYDVQPKELPDLFKGSSLTVLGRYRNMSNNDRASIVLSGNINGKAQSFTYEGKLPSETHNDHDFIAPLWAARSVGYLLDQIRLHGESKELVDETVKLAKKYGIVTPYTSYLIMEDDKLVRLPPNPRPNPNPGPFPPMPPRPIPMPRIMEKSSKGAGVANDAAMEYESMKQKEGEGSVRSSTEIQSLNHADNMAQTKQGQSRMAYSDEQGNSETIAQQYRNVQGRAVYRTNQDNETWIDAEVYNHPEAKRQRIKFASDEYFKLLTQEPNAKQFVALGRNVQFWTNGQVYEIYE
jgi:Ca-activated chloride channel family protein